MEASGKDQDKKQGMFAKMSGILKKPFAYFSARKTKRAILRTMRSMGQEKEETVEMAKSFFKLLESKLNLKDRKTPPTPDELKAAIDQLVDLGRFSVFAGISILPGGGFGLIGLEMLARKFGLKNFTFLPSAFREKTRKRKRLKKVLVKSADPSTITPVHNPYKH